MGGEVRGSLPALGVVQPRLEDCYLKAAEQFLHGAELLRDADADALAPCTLLAGQALEGALKAFLASKGACENELKDKDVRHGLIVLWEKSRHAGLKLEDSAPAWCQILDGLHNSPYVLRYRKASRDGFVNGVGYPPQREMVEGVRYVLEEVREELLSARSSSMA